jgi:hypothetical protein
MAETLPYVTSTDALPYGSRIVTIGATAYIANNFNISRPSTLLERKTHLGAPNGARLLKNAKTGTADLQLATSATPLPARGEEFAGEASDGVAAWFITEVTDGEVNDGLKTVSISFREKI